jgi:magnesium chelatase subunit D
MEQAAKAHAAFNRRVHVTVEDIREVAPMVLVHRRREAAPPPPPPPPPPQPEPEHREEHPPEEDRQNRPEEQLQEFPPQKPETKRDEIESDSDQNDGNEKNDEREEAQSTNYDQVLERIFEIGETFRVRRISAPKDRILRRGSGRRSRTRTAQKQGRYVRSSLKGSGTDVALDATLRAAAPYQLMRRGTSPEGLAVYLAPQDVRHKIREKRIGNFLLFVVDASGSMGAQGRMTATKGAIMSLLLDAYQKRDRVAMVTFRRNEAEIKLPPTSSVELAARLLRDLPVGGRTPLSAGLVKAYEVVRTVLLKDPTARPIVVIITDGKANVSLNPSRKPVDEAFLVAQRFASDERIFPVVVDTEKRGIVQFGLAQRLAAIMRAPYFRIEDLKAESLVQIVKEVVG